MFVRPAAAGIAAISMLAAAAAEAHTGAHAASGLAGGFTHPLLGLDHVLAMLAVGVWAAQQGGRALWALPAAFVATMLAGGALGFAGLGLPAVELGVAGSVLLLGLLIAGRSRLPLTASVALVGLFALLHGHAHGAEAPAGAAPLLYAAGFAAATLLLHGLGIALTRLAMRGLPALAVRSAGLGIATAGGLLLIGL